jgi:hypothetical protein
MTNKMRTFARGLLSFVWLTGLFAGPLLLGDASAATLNVPGQYSSVQAAFNAAQPGDTILLSPGVYNESVVTVRNGSSEQRIVLDGRGVGTIKQFTFRHSYITVQNITFTGVTTPYSGLVSFDHNGHHGILSNCVLDVALAPKVNGIRWQSSNTKPFGQGEVASYCTIVDNEIRNVLGTTMVSIMGDFNRVVGNYIHDGGAVDFFRVFGRNNYIGYNNCHNNYKVQGVENHPDFIQTFGNNGDGSQGHIIEGNHVTRIEGGQLTQLEGNLVPETRDWTFRNNIFIDVALQASCTIPDVKYYNNLFYRCNKLGHALTFGTRHYDTSYSGQSGTNYAHGARVVNNVFLECGDNRNVIGWYTFLQGLENVLADFNYVGKAGYVPVDQDPLKRPVGNPSGWATWGGWWEPNGLNGGDPKFLSIEKLDFQLHEDSPLIDRGLNLQSSFNSDILKLTRGTRWDIGAYEYGAPPIIAPPSNIRVLK